MSDWIPLDDAAGILCISADTLRNADYRDLLRGLVRRRYQKIRAGKGRSSLVLNRADCEALARVRRERHLSLRTAAKAVAEGL